jgi:hypothetical protein
MLIEPFLDRLDDVLVFPPPNTTLLPLRAEILDRAVPAGVVIPVVS